MLLLVDKPTGITSYDIIRVLKKKFPGEKIGHAGTLDPLATGAMLIGIGKDTKRLTELTGKDKSYITTIDFSQDSDTRDIDYRDYLESILIHSSDGRTNKQGQKISLPSLKEIEQKLQELIPEKELPLTPFSAKKVSGKKLYEEARKGNIISTNKIMSTQSFEIVSYEFPILTVKLTVGSGTYIRSIAHWLGSEFGMGGILTTLRRISIDKWSIGDICKSSDRDNLAYEEIFL
ncbi:MAG TPA: hypothetical protein PKD96_00890 [Candidatus Absconditabacterales bacterium]|nr:hypothetical protein [Candidatus Absconditabacterales bacterium]